MDKKLTTLALFIDFKKAFDTVDSNLLISKLFHYGFETNSLFLICFLIADYFKNRQQITKINNSSSKPNVVLLGVPQGSILGPLFFLIYINDLIYLSMLPQQNCLLMTQLYTTQELIYLKS
jgi:hypothetical protein